mmetsp:Transcript_15223/g.22381  ORF Transcript_15223/g.22381 Transcript_15223/m.22381 type:complete len:235 (+) Transcript_15223:91-795(+)
MKFALCKRSMLALAALLTTPLLTTAEDYGSNECQSTRHGLAKFYLADINYPKKILSSDRKAAIRSFSRGWKSLTRGGDASCKEAINPKAVTDLVKVCDGAGLDYEDCDDLLDTLVWLISQEEGDEENKYYEDYDDEAEAEEEPVGKDATEQAVFCTEDAYHCGGNVWLSRDPANGCAFPPCPKTASSTLDVDKGEAEIVFCTMDMFRCPDGTLVGRDFSNNCNFRPCPTAKPPV